MGMRAFAFLKVKFSQMKNLAFCVLFFQMSSHSLFFTFQIFNEDIYFLKYIFIKNEVYEYMLEM